LTESSTIASIQDSAGCMIEVCARCNALQLHEAAYL